MSKPRGHTQPSTLRHAGFTVMELLIVIGVIGILAGMAFTSWSATRESAIMATLKSDVKSLAALEESYRARNGAYWQSWAFVPVGPDGWLPTSGNVVDVYYAPAEGGLAVYVGHKPTRLACRVVLQVRSTDTGARDQCYYRPDPAWWGE